MVECTLSITHCLRLNLQLHTIDLVRTCRISSFCTVAWQLARFQLTRRIARSLGDSWASCFLLAHHVDVCQSAGVQEWTDLEFLESTDALHLLNQVVRYIQLSQRLSGHFLHSIPEPITITQSDRATLRAKCEPAFPNTASVGVKAGTSPLSGGG